MLAALCLSAEAWAGVPSAATLDTLKLVASQGYKKTDEGPRRDFSIIFDEPLYRGGKMTFRNSAGTWSLTVPEDTAGIRKVESSFPIGYMEEESCLTVHFESPQGSFDQKLLVPAARKWTVYFLPHSHQDIGYTHHQEEVMRLQWRNLEKAMELAQKTKEYPEGSRFKWNSEATWPILKYLETYNGTGKDTMLVNAIKNGTINIDASLGSILSGISRQEELMHYFDDAHKIEELTGVRLSTAMMSDVPGQAWGLATALAKNGVSYFSPAPNYVPFYGRIGNDRAAAITLRWGDHPFYWESQSGTDKVLVWLAGRGYSWFHNWLAGSLSVCGIDPIWQYLQELEMEEFPYDLCYLRYTVSGDNGPPDEEMPDIIKDWNNEYEWPKFKIATTKELFTDFEGKYKDVIPTFRGDLTPTWEDGSESTARETAMNRESSSNLAQSEILLCMLNKAHDFPFDSLYRAWRNVVLFSEHTWGASASGPEPDSPFTKELWAGKKSYADSAARLSGNIRSFALNGIRGKGNYIQVINTNLWNRTDVVYVDKDLSGKGLTDSFGNKIPIQKLSDGRWAFIAEDVPAMSSSVYKIIKDKSHDISKTDQSPRIEGDSLLFNDKIKIILDQRNGTIKSIKELGADDYEYVAGGLNDYLYTGRVASNPQGIDEITSIKILEDGPVCSAIRVISKAPGCNSLTRDIYIYKGLKRIDIVNTLDKKDIRDFENVRFIFPFNFSHPEISMDLAMSEVHPEREQLEGVNKNYYCVQNGLSVGDYEHKICLFTTDAPLVELGSPSGEDYRLNKHIGYGWWASAQLSPIIYSWVMTNIWRTNYKASQGGITTFRYSILPGDALSMSLKQSGLEAEQKMIALESPNKDRIPYLFRLGGKNKISLSSIAPSKDGSGYILHLQNLGNEPVITKFIWGKIKGKKASSCDWREIPLEKIDPNNLTFKPYEYKVLKISCE